MIALPKPVAVSQLLNASLSLVEEMHASIKSIKKKNLSEEDCIQLCFEAATNCKEQVIALVRTYHFRTLDEEIFFFKKIKPVISAEVEYYTYRYHVVLFKTQEAENYEAELKSFYKRQLLRKEKFKNEFEDFCKYVTEDSTYADKEWFTRHSQSKDSSLFDGLMGRYLAIEKFEMYIKGLMSRGI
ncbi:MAG: hypothetical protein GXC73_19110 [Chitinophagaceae bacterium]|nr:hypothetical protein [Chitinophagaceae bacterium]